MLLIGFGSRLFSCVGGVHFHQGSGAGAPWGSWGSQGTMIAQFRAVLSALNSRDAFALHFFESDSVLFNLDFCSICLLTNHTDLFHVLAEEAFL